MYLHFLLFSTYTSLDKSDICKIDSVKEIVCSFGCHRICLSYNGGFSQFVCQLRLSVNLCLCSLRCLNWTGGDSPSRLATMVTSPVPDPSSSTSFPCRFTLCLLLSRKEHRANACRTKTTRPLTVACYCPCSIQLLLYQAILYLFSVFRGTHCWPHHCSVWIYGLINEDVLPCVMVDVFINADADARSPR